MGLFGSKRFARYTVHVVWLGLILCGVQQFDAARPQSTLPSEISNEEFRGIVADFSEPGGQFTSENFSSNERGYQLLIPRLQQVVAPGGVYVGVGPEQNFQYIAGLRPALAFIVDIRRQNLVQHLMYKAAFEMSADRAEFLSRIFSKPRPEGVGPESSAAELMTAYREASESPERTTANIQAIKGWIGKERGFALTFDDERTLEHVMKVFARYGTNLNYGSNLEGLAPARVGGANQPTYSSIMELLDQNGDNRSFLASEETYGIVREMQQKNLIVPVVGDFGGPKALRAVGEYVRQHQSTVSVFYLSNVEQYLFGQGSVQNGGWVNFYRSVATLPLNESSVFIRSGNAQGARRGGGLTPVMSSILDVLRAFNDGRLSQFADVLALSSN